MARKPTPKCIHCGRPLPYWCGPTDQARWQRAYPDREPPPLTRGVDGKGYFCVKRCAIEYANKVALRAIPRNVDGTPREG